MTPDELPDDVAKWPADPFELLGVRPGQPERELKRAYSSRIRRFKPEQFPNHFRRLRDAYEFVRTFAGAASAEPGEEPTGTPPAPLSMNATPPVGRQPSRGAAPADSLDAQLHEAWDQACDGDEAGAARRLTDLNQRYPKAVTVYLRLYWLALVAPDVLPDQPALSWLIQGLVACAADRRLQELYRRHVDEHPEDAVAAGCDRLFGPSVDVNVVRAALSVRWRAAGRLGRWPIVRLDVEQARARLLAHDQHGWTRLLLDGVVQLVWAKSIEEQEIVRAWCREIEQLASVGSPVAQELDSLDFMLEIAAGCRSVRTAVGLSVLVLGMIPYSFTSAPVELLPHLEPLYAQTVRDPVRALHDLQTLQQQAPVLVRHYGQILERFYQDRPRPPQRSVQAVFQVMISYYGGLTWLADWPASREEFLTFCLRECLTFDEVAVSVLQCMRLPDGSVQDRLVNLMNDERPLRCVCLAHQLFWA